MKNIFEIVKFYESKIDSNLFKKKEFSTKELSIINNHLSIKNKELIEFLRDKISSYKINVKALQAMANERYKIHRSVHSKAENYLIPDLEQIPLYRYAIEFKQEPLLRAYSAIAVVNNLTDLIHQLESEYPNNIKLDYPVKPIGLAAPYLNLCGYYRHIFIKIIAPEFLKQDCYNKKEKQIDKIDEFLNIFIDTPHYLPINYPYKIVEKTEDQVEEGFDSFINEMNYSSSIQSQAFELFP